MNEIGSGNINRARGCPRPQELDRFEVFATGASSLPRLGRATTAHFARAGGRCGSRSTASSPRSASSTSLHCCTAILTSIRSRTSSACRSSIHDVTRRTRRRPAPRTIRLLAAEQSTFGCLPVREAYVRTPSATASPETARGDRRRSIDVKTPSACRDASGSAPSTTSSSAPAPPSAVDPGRGDDKNSARLKVLETACERPTAHVE